MSLMENITGERFKSGSIPGSFTYYLENKEPIIKFTSEITYTDEEINHIFPRCFNFNYEQDRNPDEELVALDWKFDEGENKFYHEKYFVKEINSEKKYIYFDIGIKTWNGKRYFVPLQNSEHIDNLGITWSFSNAGTIWSLNRNKVFDYWGNRKGKRMSKYIEYRKIRDKRSQMFQNIKV